MNKAATFRSSCLAVLLLPFLSCQTVAGQEMTVQSIAVTPAGAPANQADPANALRILRPAGGFKTKAGDDQSQDAVEKASEQENAPEPVFSAARVWASATMAQDSIFSQVLDGFTARWQRRLGTPAACAMVLCQGSCAESDAACEIGGSWRGESAGCSSMPAGTESGCAEDHACGDKSHDCAGQEKACAPKAEACGGNDESCAAK